MKKFTKITSLFLALILLISGASVSAFAAETGLDSRFPPADGIDIGVNNEDESDAQPMSFWYSKYNYNSEAFGVGVYLNGGKAFSCRSSRNPYLQNANHSKVNNTNPSVYRVTYQMIYSSNGEVRKGVYFTGDIEDLKVYFDVEETNDFIFYIAGESSNTYCASGTLRY